jgi:type II secretory ATPase GspE/PulE/Tfp pilus assembly ATPase PilB-like protein
MRKICEHCKQEYDPAEEVIADIKNILGGLLPSGPMKLYRGRNCPECNDTGYLDRVGIFEVLPVSEKISRLILEHKPAVDIEKAAAADGMILMKHDGYLKALEGITTLEEVLRVAQT